MMEIQQLLLYMEWHPAVRCGWDELSAKYTMNIQKLVVSILIKVKLYINPKRKNKQELNLAIFLTSQKPILNQSLAIVKMFYLGF